MAKIINLTTVIENHSIANCTLSLHWIYGQHLSRHFESTKWGATIFMTLLLILMGPFSRVQLCEMLDVRKWARRQKLHLWFFLLLS